jgi:UDP-N-acetylglucosamine 2-epimerase (non-hydrolysing)
MPLVDLIAGARPNFMKVAPIIHAMQTSGHPGLRYRLIHTGQHADAAMSATLFDQLRIPEPDAKLGVHSGSGSSQAAEMMLRYEEIIAARRPDLCIVVGDVTSTVACAMTARMLGVPVAHVEAGLRSRDWSMPEETNRIITDSISSWLFTTTESASRHLRDEVMPDESILLVGNTMVDTLLANIDRLRPPAFWNDLSLEAQGYLILTLHRPSNVDDHESLAGLLATISQSARNDRVIFPVHPRTRRALEAVDIIAANVICVEPQPYLEFNFLVRNAKAVITDSGGITEEATVMGIPCLTVRDTTERPETVSIGTNDLVGADAAGLASALDLVSAGRWKKGRIPELWDGSAATRIVDHVARILNA